MKAVLFDWGETLVTETPTEITNPFCETFFKACKNKVNLCEIENTLNQINLSIFKNLKNKKLTVPYSLIHQILTDTLGINLDCTYKEIEYDYYLNTYTPSPKNNAQKTLSALIKQNVRVGIITNNRFSSTTIAKLFNDIFPGINLSVCISSADYIIGKPNPLIFEIALKKIKIKPEHTLFCGDRVKYDIKGAMNAGVRSALLKTHRNQSIPENTVIIDDLYNLLELI